MGGRGGLCRSRWVMLVGLVEMVGWRVIRRRMDDSYWGRRSPGLREECSNVYVRKPLKIIGLFFPMYTDLGVKPRNANETWRSLTILLLLTTTSQHLGGLIVVTERVHSEGPLSSSDTFSIDYHFRLRPLCTTPSIAFRMSLASSPLSHHLSRSPLHSSAWFLCRWQISKMVA